MDDFDSSTADSGLGTEVRTDNDRPPLGGFVFGPAYDGTCFIIKDNRLYYCRPKQPEAWPPLYYIEIGQLDFPGVTGVFFNGQPHYLTKNNIYFIQGTAQGVFNPVPMSSKTGAQSVRGAVAITGKGIFHTGPDGIYLYSGSNDQRITEPTLEPIFRGEAVGALPGVANMTSSWLWAFKNHLYFGYTASGSTNPENILVMNLETSRINHYTYNDGSSIAVRAITTDNANNRLIVGDAAGFVRVIENTAYTDDSGTAIEYDIQSKDFTLQTRKHFPRWVKYDVDASDATTCSGKMLLDGAVHHTHAISGSRNTVRRLVGGDNGNKLAIRISGTGPATVYSAEFE